MDSLFLIFNKWERIVIAVLIILVGVLYSTIFFKDKDIKNLKLDLNKSKIENLSLSTKLEFQNQEIEKLKVDYDTNINMYQKTKEHIVTKYRDKIIKVNKLIYKDGKLDTDKECKVIKELINETVDTNTSK